jgi:hypothetical protein
MITPRPWKIAFSELLQSLHPRACANYFRNAGCVFNLIG